MTTTTEKLAHETAMKIMRVHFPEETEFDLMVQPMEENLTWGWSSALILHGPTGTGKTVLATQLAYDFVANRMPYNHPLSFPVAMGDLTSRLLATIASTRNQDLGNTDPLVHYTRAGLLVLDDLGQEKLSDAKLSYLESILGARYSTRRPTIVTTNLTPVEIEDMYGPRVVSRLFNSRSTVHTMAGKDRR